MWICFINDTLSDTTAAMVLLFVTVTHDSPSDVCRSQAGEWNGDMMETTIPIPLGL